MQRLPARLTPGDSTRQPTSGAYPNEQARFARRRHPRRGALDQQGRRRAPVPVEEIRRRSVGPAGTHPVRARLVDGLDADLRPAGAGPDGSSVDGMVRGARLRHLVRRHGGLRPSTKTRDNNRLDLDGADDCFAAATYIQKLRGKKPLLVYGISSGALRAALFAQRHPEMVARLALDAMVWTGEGSPTLADRAKRLPEFRAKDRRPIDRAFVHSIFTRDHPGTADDDVIKAFADAILKLDDSVPTGTYVDMCANLPVCDPEKIKAATIIMRGQWDGIASFQDLVNFFDKLPNPDKQFAVMPGIAHASLQQKNYAIVYHILESFFTQPEPIYRGH